MRVGRFLTLLVAVVGLFLSSATLTASAAGSPVPGGGSGVSGDTQPASASVGSPTQSNSSATVSTGRTSSTADGQNAMSTTCGADAAAGGNGFGAQPTQAGTSGTATPTGCGRATNATNSVALNGRTANTNKSNDTVNSKAGGSSTASGRESGLASAGLVSPQGNGWMANAGMFGWLFLALLLAFLLILLGAALGRRRQSARVA